MIRTLSSIVLVLALAAPSFGQSVAMVADLSGKAAWEGGKTLRLMDEIPANLTLNLEAGGRLVLVHMKTGEELVFAGPCKLRFNAQGHFEGARPQHQRKVQALQGSIQLKPGALAQASVVMRNPLDPKGPKWPFVQPRGPWILDPTPEFTWEKAEGKVEYRFKFANEKGEVILELNLDEPGLKIPKHLALKEKEPYIWFLNVQMPDGSTRSTSGMLKLLDAKQREHLLKSKPKPRASFSERLIYASLLEQCDVKDEAKKRWKELAKERPEDSGLQNLARD